MEFVTVVKYAEIHLKGLNRPFFEKKLVERIRQSLLPEKAEIIREQGRIFIYGLDETKQPFIQDKLSKVFGIHSFCFAVCTVKDWDTICSEAVKLMKQVTPGLTFKVFAKRSDKRFPLTSEEICRELGGVILDNCPDLSVDIHKPTVRLNVEIRQNSAFVYNNEIPGPGGMPVGTNGKAMLLISGGIDSPVAGHMIAKRGVSLAAVHFYSYPYTSERARDKVIDLAKIISSYSGPFLLYLCPFTEIQTTIYDKCPSSETTILMRRLMMKIAERWAVSSECQALITGESIGQVASQTIESLAVTDNAVNMPVFRPLIGFDKEEIIERAKHIGTFDTSILPFEDCCTVFVPQHPVTKPKIDRICQSEAIVEFEPMINACIENTERMLIYPDKVVPIIDQ